MKTKKGKKERSQKRRRKTLTIRKRKKERQTANEKRNTNAKKRKKKERETAREKNRYTNKKKDEKKERLHTMRSSISSMMCCFSRSKVFSCTTCFTLARCSSSDRSRTFSWSHTSSHSSSSNLLLLMDQPKHSTWHQIPMQKIFDILIGVWLSEYLFCFSRYGAGIFCCNLHVTLNTLNDIQTPFCTIYAFYLCQREKIMQWHRTE